MYVRALSDFDLQARDEYALKEQAKLRRRLQDPESDDYLIHLDWIDGATEEVLRATVLSYEEASFRRQSLTEIKDEIIPIPDDADEEEKDDILQQREAQQAKTAERREEWVSTRLAVRRGELETKSADELKRLAKTAVTNLQLWILRVRLFDAYTLFAAVFEDDGYKKHYIHNPSEAFDLPTDSRTEILKAYYAEMEQVSTLDLKYFLSTGGSPVT